VYTFWIDKSAPTRLPGTPTPQPYAVDISTTPPNRLSTYASTMRSCAIVLIKLPMRSMYEPRSPMFRHESWG
jgi:hypothetical protein